MLCFFFNDTATTEIYTLSLHDALPISGDYLTYVDFWFYEVLDWHRIILGKDVLDGNKILKSFMERFEALPQIKAHMSSDRKSTRLNSSHSQISYAVFCLKKKKNAPARSDAYIVRAIFYTFLITCIVRSLLALFVIRTFQIIKPL